MSQSSGSQTTRALALGAIGVVYGDIGTSPLYTMKEIFGAGGVAVDATGITGAVSTVFWALMLIVTLKYVIFVLRANNRGEGGVMSLLSLAMVAAGNSKHKREVLFLMGALGAALFYGDSVITPAVSVLGAVEGLHLVAPEMDRFVLPISVGILVALFLVQRRGTEAVGRMFGPIMLTWFLVLGGMGLWHIAEAPQILHALNPLYAAQFVADRGPLLLFALAAIVLAVTGAEALYADMGHFGARAIRLAWSVLVLPCLALNYLGQGAMLLAHPEYADNPFYRMFPDVVLIPAVMLAAAAAIIASQAVITGAYSLTQQVIQLGFLPRMPIVHTSHHLRGQIYMPHINWILMVAVLGAAVGFGSSSALAGAYGLAVTMAMLIDTALLFLVATYRWKVSPLVAWPALLAFVCIDVLLVAACATKLFDGGWFTLTIAIGIMLLMATWRTGRRLAAGAGGADELALEPFLRSLMMEPIPRVPRTAVFLMSDTEGTPRAMLHNLKHNMVLHERNVLLTVIFQEVPVMPAEERLQVEELEHGFWRVTMNFGYMENPDVPEHLKGCAALGLDIDMFSTSFFINRQTIVSTAGSGMPEWREQLFATMYRNSSSVVNYFNIPHNSVIELGTRVAI
jgi:KUP system potassium uptake protein